MPGVRMTPVHLVEYALAVLVFVLLLAKIRQIILRQILLLVASYSFYVIWGSYLALAILVCSTLFNFCWGAHLRRNASSARLWVGVGLNSALLSLYKFVPALAQSYLSPVAQYWAHLAVPIGISFWTFQGLSYLFDQYREEDLDPTLLEFALYMAFAPTVLSGPIGRLTDILPQFRRVPHWRWDDIRYGIQRIWLGILCTSAALILAQGFHRGRGIDAAFTSAGDSAIDNWFLAFGYGLQLFLDFAGYSHIVIGIARLFGIRLAENFNKPFLSRSPSEFWTRWHMSLSFWIRDYVFLPLATVRREMWWRNFALLGAMVVFGVWHRASLLFLTWGAYQGMLLVLHRLWQQASRKLNLNWSGKVANGLSTVVTIAAMSAGWLIFRGDTLHHGLHMFFRLFSLRAYLNHALPAELYLMIVVLGGTCFLSWALAGAEDGERSVFEMVPVELRFAGYAVACYLALFLGAVPPAFVYTQF
jgi:D-alanyl-lipoteichoic acid acyltransferase DltB (MBOAT superfamily)